jgi:hypothetical protein
MMRNTASHFQFSVLRSFEKFLINEHLPFSSKLQKVFKRTPRQRHLATLDALNKIDRQERVHTLHACPPFFCRPILRARSARPLDFNRRRRQFSSGRRKPSRLHPFRLLQLLLNACNSRKAEFALRSRFKAKKRPWTRNSPSKVLKSLYGLSRASFVVNSRPRTYIQALIHSSRNEVQRFLLWWSQRGSSRT